MIARRKFNKMVGVFRKKYPDFPLDIYLDVTYMFPFSRRNEYLLTVCAERVVAEDEVFGLFDYYEGILLSDKPRRVNKFTVGRFLLKALRKYISMRLDGER